MKKIDWSFISQLILPLIIVFVLVLIGIFFVSEPVNNGQPFNLGHEIKVFIHAVPIIAALYIVYRFIELLKDNRKVSMMEIKKYSPDLKEHQIETIYKKSSRISIRFDAIAFGILFLGLCMLISYV